MDNEIKNNGGGGGKTERLTIHFGPGLQRSIRLSRNELKYLKDQAINNNLDTAGHEAIRRLNLFCCYSGTKLHWAASKMKSSFLVSILTDPRNERLSDRKPRLK